ncbi:MAG: hypothetical protein JWM34_3549 [Ilumatobacteraceae bacterium]|nr:hypothetical protein [Ilumatobacteraceae bacterium]
MRSARSLASTLAIAALSTVLLTGCFTGKRGHFANDADAASAAVSDPAIQAVLTNLGAANTSQYTATYTVITKYGNTTRTAIVAQSAPDTRSITIGHVRFLDQPSGAQTCELTTGVCQTGILDQSVSDTQLTHDFYSSSASLRLRQDVNTMVSAATPSTKTIAGQPATCAQVFFTDGSKTYCALADGLLAQQDTPDVRVDLTALTTGADQSLFTPTTVAG